MLLQRSATSHSAALLAMILGLPGTAAETDSTKQPAVIETEFIFEKAPFAQCHASTLAQSGDALVAAWFAGTREGNSDVGIWFARRIEGKWSEPTKVADGRQESGRRFPCWNPVLFQPDEGPLLLFYKVGPSPRAWWGMLLRSEDGGQSWSEPVRLPEGIFGPIKNKPVMLASGVLLCGSSTEDEGWRVHFERTPDLGKTWETVGPVNDGKQFSAIQPTLLLPGEGVVQTLCRSRQGRIVQVVSEDGGRSWGEMTATPLPNPNSGIDAVTLADGRHLLVYNHTRRGRSPLNVAVSDDGESWQAAIVLEDEPGEYSYPAVIQTADGRVHISYTWKRRRIKHVVLEPGKLDLGPLPDR